MLTRCAWAAAIVLCLAALLFWPVGWTWLAPLLFIGGWFVRKQLATPIALILLFGVVAYIGEYEPNLFGEAEPTGESLLTPNPTGPADYDGPVFAWLTDGDPYYFGAMLPATLVVVPILLIAAVFIAYRTGKR